MFEERTRAYIYRVLTLVAPILVFYGVLADTAVALWLGLAGGVLALGEGAMASLHTSTDRDVAPRR